MKIYNKTKFAAGVFMIALGALNLATNMMRKAVDINAMILIIALFVLGLSSVAQSMSRKMAQEDKLEELDERNRLIALKSKAKSFQIIQGFSFVLMIAFFVMGGLSGYEGFIAMAVGVAFVFTISMFAEIFTFIYYESKN